jgi:hypothetical protein
MRALARVAPGLDLGPTQSEAAGTGRGGRGQHPEVDHGI